MKVGLVLGGGGIVGVAWERGLIEGLAEAGVDLRAADYFVGTSAGSLVGSMLASGRELRSEDPDQILPDLPTPEAGPDLAVAGEVLKAWSAIETPSAEGCAEVGAWALKAKTCSEASGIAATGGGIGVSGWPNTDLRISIVDAVSGNRMLVDRKSGMSLDRVVAASCAVPGLFPPVEIAGRQYVDGGVWSGTHADCLVEDAPEWVVVIAPLVKGVAAFGALMERALEAEVQALEAAGSRVLKVLPEAADQERFGPNLMAEDRAIRVRAFARERGRALAKNEDWGRFGSDLCS